MGGVISCLRKSAPVTSPRESKAAQPAAPAGLPRVYISTAVPMVRSRVAANDLQDNLHLILSYRSQSSPQALMRQVIEAHPAQMWAASDLQHVFDQLTDSAVDLSTDRIQDLATGLCKAHGGRLTELTLNCEASPRASFSHARGEAFRSACSAAAGVS